jgi:hypothetical protein
MLSIPTWFFPALPNAGRQGPHMSPVLSYVMAHHRIAGLHRTARRERLATQAAGERRNPGQSNPITRLAARLAHLTARLAPSRP